MLLGAALEITAPATRHIQKNGRFHIAGWRNGFWGEMVLVERR